MGWACGHCRRSRWSSQQAWQVQVCKWRWSSYVCWGVHHQGGASNSESKSIKGVESSIVILRFWIFLSLAQTRHNKLMVQLSCWRSWRKSASSSDLLMQRRLSKLAMRSHAVPHGSKRKLLQDIIKATTDFTTACPKLCSQDDMFLHIWFKSTLSPVVTPIPWLPTKSFCRITPKSRMMPLRNARSRHTSMSFHIYELKGPGVIRVAHHQSFLVFINPVLIL